MESARQERRHDSRATASLHEVRPEGDGVSLVEIAPDCALPGADSTGPGFWTRIKHDQVAGHGSPVGWRTWTICLSSLLEGYGERADGWIKSTTTDCVALSALVAWDCLLSPYAQSRRAARVARVGGVAECALGGGMILAASTTLLANSRSGHRGGVLPWALPAAGSMASLAADVAVARQTLIGRVIAAWPSFALTASYEFLTCPTPCPGPMARGSEALPQHYAEPAPGRGCAKPTGDAPTSRPLGANNSCDIEYLRLQGTAWAAASGHQKTIEGWAQPAMIRIGVLRLAPE